MNDTLKMLVRLAHERPERRAALLPLIRTALVPARTRPDFARAFDKPGTYHPVKLVGIGGFSSGREVPGYLRDDEIAEGKRDWAENLRSMEDWQKKYHDAYRAKSGDLYEKLSDYNKTDADWEKFLREYDAKVQRVQRANSFGDLHASLAFDKGLGITEGGDPLVLDKALHARAWSRGSDIKFDLRDSGPGALRKLIEKGVTLSDQPNLVQAGKDTQQAIDALKRRVTQAKAEVARQREEIRKGIEAAATEILNVVKTKYPGADPEKLPSVLAIMSAIDR